MADSTYIDEQDLIQSKGKQLITCDKNGSKPITMTDKKTSATSTQTSKQDSDDINMKSNNSSCSESTETELFVDIENVESDGKRPFDPSINLSCDETQSELYAPKTDESSDQSINKHAFNNEVRPDQKLLGSKGKEDLLNTIVSDNKKPTFDHNNGMPTLDENSCDKERNKNEIITDLPISDQISSGNQSSSDRINSSRECIADQISLNNETSDQISSDKESSGQCTKTEAKENNVLQCNEEESSLDHPNEASSLSSKYPLSSNATSRETLVNINATEMKAACKSTDTEKSSLSASNEVYKGIIDKTTLPEPSEPKPIQSEIQHDEAITDEEELNNFANKANSKILKHLKEVPKDVPEALFNFESHDSASGKRQRIQTQKIKESVQQETELSPKKRKKKECGQKGNVEVRVISTSGKGKEKVVESTAHAINKEILKNCIIGQFGEEGPALDPEPLMPEVIKENTCSSETDALPILMVKEKNIHKSTSISDADSPSTTFAYAGTSVTRDFDTSLSSTWSLCNNAISTMDTNSTADTQQQMNNVVPDSDPLSLNNIQPFDGSLPDNSRPNGYLFPNQPVYDHMMLEGEENMDISTEMLKNRDVDSLVAAQLMTSLARGDLIFDQHNHIQAFNQAPGQQNYQDPQVPNPAIPIPDQNNNMYPVQNTYGLQRNHAIGIYDNTGINYYSGSTEVGITTNVDPKRHSFPGGDVGHGYGYPGQTVPLSHNRTHSESAPNLDNLQSAFSHIMGQEPTVNGNTNLLHPQPCYPDGHPGMRPYPDASYYNEPFIAIPNPSNANPTRMSRLPAQVQQDQDVDFYAIHKGPASLNSTQFTEISNDSDDSAEFAAAGTYEYQPCYARAGRKRSYSLGDTLENAALIPKHPRKSRSTRTRHHEVMDKLHHGQNIATPETGKRRHKKQRSLDAFFMIVSPNINPKEVESIDHKGLIAKYIDYLLIENEQITEMSKSVSVPIENCVMDDPYLMDIIKVKIPFPTPKYLQWLRVYYPTIQVDWEAVNQELSTYIPDANGQKKRTYYLDNRPSPVLLGESFYFFQREKDRLIQQKVQ